MPKKSECVSLFKWQFHDFPFASSSLHLHNTMRRSHFDDASAKKKKHVERLSIAFVWSMTQLCLALYTHRRRQFRLKKAQKIAARMISLEIYARIRNQKWIFQWLACTKICCRRRWLIKSFAVTFVKDLTSSLRNNGFKWQSSPWFWNSLGSPYHNTLETIKAKLKRFSKWKNVYIDL